MTAAILLSAARDDADRRRALSRSPRAPSRSPRAWRSPGLYAGLDRADPARDRLEPRLRRDLRRARGRRRLGLAEPRLDADLHRRSTPIRSGICRCRCCSTSSRTTPGSTGRTAGCTGPRPFRIAHAVHHASRPPTAWAAMAFHPIEALTGAVVIPLLVFVIPIHVAALGLGAGDHDGYGRHQPHGLGDVSRGSCGAGPLGGWLITASHHQRHHAEYRCNYGLYFRFWDRLCGTDRGLGDFDRATPGGARRAAGGGAARCRARRRRARLMSRSPACARPRA